jgi:hypothetical protein
MTAQVIPRRCKNLVYEGRELGLKERDFNDLLQCHAKEFNNKDFMKYTDHKKKVPENEQEVEPKKKKYGQAWQNALT